MLMHTALAEKQQLIMLTNTNDDLSIVKFEKDGRSLRYLVARARAKQKCARTAK